MAITQAPERTWIRYVKTERGMNQTGDFGCLLWGRNIFYCLEGWQICVNPLPYLYEIPGAPGRFGTTYWSSVGNLTQEKVAELLKDRMITPFDLEVKYNLPGSIVPVDTTIFID
ncbi:MAG: hypothetical protein NT076_04745 [Candidatus Pacearchaeota archaeon]|nr:hypothetical protein [Candidatus Pacearchaeota archaeon]